MDSVLATPPPGIYYRLSGVAESVMQRSVSLFSRLLTTNYECHSPSNHFLSDTV